MNRIFGKFTVCFCLLIFISSAGSATETSVDRHLIFIVDFSGSVKANLPDYWDVIGLVTGCSNAPETRDDPKAQCSKLGVKKNDQVTVFKITGESRRNPDIVADAFFKAPSIWDNKYKFNRQALAEVKNPFVDKIVESFKTPGLADNTEILGAIRLAKQYFDDVGAEEKVLIILSDMIEESEFYNFQKQSVDPEKIIENEKKNNRLPDLSGVEVYVSGASAKTEDKYDAIKTFWTKYFEVTGARLNDHYRPKMIHFQ